MSLQIRKPEVVRLDLGDGDWLLVRKYLTAGETRRQFRRMMRRGATGNEIDPLQVGLTKIVAYLVDSSITDPDGQRVDVRDMTEEQIAATLEMLPPDDFGRILNAIEIHEAAGDAEKKTIPIGDPKSQATCESPAPSVGGTNGLVN